MKESPLFWPVILKKDHLLVLDETGVPKVQYIKVKDYRAAVRLIKQMKVRAFGQLLIVLYVLSLECVKMKSKSTEAFLKKLSQIKQAIDASRPTFPFAQVTGMVLSWAQAIAGEGGDVVEGVSARIEGFLEAIRKQRYAQAQKAANLLNNNDTVLTHCNISGSLPLIAELCRKENKTIRFFATETRPYFQGARLTAWELQRAGFEVTVIVDSAVASLMRDKKISKVIVGADCMAQNGDIANKIGTYNIAILAQQFNIPFYVLVPPVSRYKTGNDIPIEIRPEKELLEYKGKRIAAKGVKGYYPAFDVTPQELITAHIHLQ